MTSKCLGTITAGSGMRLAVTAAENAGPMAPILMRGDLADAARQAAEIGYQGLEVHVPDIWSFDVDKFCRDCHEAGIAAASLVSGQLFVRQGLSLSNPDQAVVEKAVEGLKLFVDASAKAGCSLIVGWVRGMAGPDRDAGLERQAAALRVIGSYAREKGVPVCLEAINRYEIDALNTAGEVLCFIREHDLPNTYIHLDTFHMNIEEYSAVKAIRQAGALLGYLHVAENTRRYPGHDRLNFDEVFDALEECGYDGFVSVECLPLPTGPTAAKRAHEYLFHRFVYPR